MPASPQAANKAFDGSFSSQAVTALLAIKERLGVALQQQEVDLTTALAMLKRLEVHTVTAERLSSTGLASLVRGLKQHPCEELARSARALIQSWKFQLKNTGQPEAGKLSEASPAAELPNGLRSTGEEDPAHAVAMHSGRRALHDKAL